MGNGTHLTLATEASKRRWTRHASDAPIRILSEDEGQIFPVEGTCLNTSDGGMCFFAVGNFNPGAKVSVEFVLPESHRFERVRGIIRSRTIYLYGVEYEAPVTTARRPVL